MTGNNKFVDKHQIPGSGTHVPVYPVVFCCKRYNNHPLPVRILILSHTLNYLYVGTEGNY
jgi:hypothetical protein